MLIGLFQTICKPIFGSFEREEFKKFLRMGLIFALIIGSYWTLRVLKDSIFIDLVDKHQLPWAKTASLFCLLPLVMIYTKLFDKYSREKMFYILATTYGTLIAVFAILLAVTQGPAELIANREGLAYVGTKVLGYLWYVFVESYGSLVVVLFWSFASDITSPDSAKKGFSLVVAIGQLGGIVGPVLIGGLPKMMGFQTSAISVVICSLSTLMIIVMMKYFLRVTPARLLASFHGANEKSTEKEQEPGFLEGLRLILQHKYLMGIFSIIFIYEVIVTIFDYNFKYLAATHYTGTELTAYLGWYGSSVNFVALACLLLGVNNITRVLGLGVALAMMPVIVGMALFGFITIDSLSFLFALMVGSKAINYALNGPAIKQLYIPTTHDVRYKSQAWIETFGSRGSKEAGSIFNMLLAPLQRMYGIIAGKSIYITLSGFLGFALVGVWFFIALFLGKTHKKAIKENKVVC